MSKIKNDTKSVLAVCDAIIVAAHEYTEAHAASRQCTSLILSSGKTNESAQIMSRYMKAEKALVAACARAAKRFPQKAIFVTPTPKKIGPNDTVMVTAKGVRVKKWRKPWTGVACHIIHDPVKRSPREEAGVGYANDPHSLV